MPMRASRFLTLAPLAAALLLSACQTVTPEERRARDQQTCSGFGFKPGTEAMARCLLDLELDRRAQSRSLQQQNAQMMWSPAIIERRVIVDRRR